MNQGEEVLIETPLSKKVDILVLFKVKVKHCIYELGERIELCHLTLGHCKL